MRQLRASLLRIAGLFGGNRRERELQAEIASHLAMHIDDNVRAGMSPAEARRQALVKLGGVERLREDHRDRAGVPILRDLGQDVRYSLRLLRRTPSFTTVAVLTLGLGIGANAAVFSVVNAVLLRPLPYPDPGRLMFVWATNARSGLTEDVASYPDFEEWRARSHSFEGLAAFTSRAALLAGAEQAETVPALQAAPGFFELFGVSPSLGRVFRPEDAVPGAPPVVVLSDSLWKRQFAARFDVVGQTIHVNERPATIVGVMPAGVSFVPFAPEELYSPLMPDPSRNHGFLLVAGRLKPGVSRRAAQADLDAVAARIAHDFPKTNRDVGVNVMPLADAMAGQARLGLLMFLGVVAVVLLIACTNVANLMLARNASREREIAVRTALGAGRRRLAQQLLTESIVLSCLGGAVGLLIAHWGTKLLVAFVSSAGPVARIDGSRIDAFVLGFTVLLSLATGVLFGTVPAIVASPRDLVGGLRDSSRTATSGVRARRARAFLMICETALALVLLAGAGMLTRALLELRNTAPGFDAARVIVADVQLPSRKFGAGPERARFFNALLSRVSALPGVESTGLVTNIPLGGNSDSLQFRFADRPGEKPFSAAVNIVSGGYFRTMGIPVRAGREFAPGDATSPQPVVVINETLARRHWPGQSAIGKRLVLPLGESQTIVLEIVGVTGDVRQRGLGVAPRPEIYVDYQQPGPGWPRAALVVRTAGNPAALTDAIKAAVRSTDRDVPIDRVRPMNDILANSLAEPRIYTILLAIFAVLALALAAVGLYGVVSYSVAQRAHEMGIRMALGAARGDVIRLVLRQGGGYTLVGIVVGVAGSIAFTRALTALMPSANASDLRPLAAVSALLMAVALGASYVPARRGARVDPALALKE